MTVSKSLSKSTPSGELQSLSPRGRRLPCSNFGRLVSSTAPKSDFIFSPFKDPFQEALIIKPFRYCALRLSLCFTVFYTLWFRHHITSALTRLSLFLSVTIFFYRHYISCPSQGNVQLHCTNWKNRCSHIKQFKIEIWGAVLTKRDMVLDVPVCNSVLADAS